MRGDRIQFSHILPVIDLALLVVLVFVPITMAALHLYVASKGSDQIHVHTADADVSLPRSEIVPLAIRMVTVSKADTIKAINLPGWIVQWLISLPTRTSIPPGWYPQALALETWQALVFPFFALPFWWLVGCGLDGLFRKEHLHWSLLLTGTMLFALCLRLDPRTPPPVENGSSRIFIGLAGWTFAFAVLPLAWITPLIRKRRQRANRSE